MRTNELKWNIIYRDYYGNEQIIASFAWMPEADAYIAAVSRESKPGFRMTI